MGHRKHGTTTATIGKQSRTPPDLENEDANSDVVLKSTHHLFSLSDNDFREEIRRMFIKCKERIDRAEKTTNTNPEEAMKIEIRKHVANPGLIPVTFKGSLSNTRSDPSATPNKNQKHNILKTEKEMRFFHRNNSF